MSIHLSKKELRKIIKCKYDDDHPCIVDHLVVGAGTASAIMVLNLTNDPKTSVIMLEWGQDLRGDPNILYLSGLNTSIRNSKYSENYNGSNSRLTPQVLYGMGRTVGGSSIHPTACRRDSPEWYDTLAQTAGPQWSYNNVLPLLKALESYVLYPTNTPIVEPQRGNTGPMIITQFPPSFFNPPAEATINEALAPIMLASTPEVPRPILDIGDADYNAGQTNYVSSNAGSQNWYQFVPNAPPSTNIIRSTTTTDIFAKITDENGKGLDGRKLQIVTGAYVERVIFHNNVAIGVEYFRDNKLQRVFAKKKVIISASTLRSPIVLEQSGIGDPAILAQANIPVKFANPNVGNHMLDQIYYNIAINANDPSLSIQCGGRLFLNTTGFSYPPFLIIPGAAFSAWTPLDYNFTSSTKTLTLAVASASEGSSHIATQNKAGQIQVSTSFFSNPQDVALGQMGAQFIKTFVDSAAVQFPALGFKMVYPPESAFVGPPSNLTPYLENSFLKGDHEIGTCRISASPVDGVVDGNLHVHGFQNLMVADLSVIPQVVDANSNDLALVIGQMAYQIITGKKITG